MLYEIRPTQQYRKSYKRLQRSGRTKDIKELERVIDLLAVDKKLASRHQDHELVGDMKCFRECHVRPDLLLIYRKYRESCILVLVNVGSHSELFS